MMMMAMRMMTLACLIQFFSPSSFCLPLDSSAVSRIPPTGHAHTKLFDNDDDDDARDDDVWTILIAGVSRIPPISHAHKKLFDDSAHKIVSRLSGHLSRMLLGQENVFPGFYMLYVYSAIFKELLDIKKISQTCKMLFGAVCLFVTLFCLFSVFAFENWNVLKYFLYFEMIYAWAGQRLSLAISILRGFSLVGRHKSFIPLTLWCNIQPNI